MAFTNDPNTITVPSTAGPNDPQIVIGEDIPVELITRYGTDINGAVVWRIDSNRYAYSAIISLPVGPYRVDGIVNKQRAVGDQVCEVFSYVLDTTGTGVVHIGGFGPGGPQPIIVVERDTEFNQLAKFWDAVDVVGNLLVGGSILGAFWDIDINGTMTIDGVSQGRGLKARDDSAIGVGGFGAEAIAMTAPAMTFESGRAYKVHFGSQVSSSVANRVLFQVRRGSITGDIKHQARFAIPGAGSLSVWCEFTTHIKRTGSDTSTSLRLTMAASAGTADLAATATSVRYFEVEDCGAAADYPNAVEII